MAQVRNREDDSENDLQTPAKKFKTMETPSHEENILGWSAVRIIRLTER